METVERLLGNWSHIQKNQKVVDLIEASVQRWGRNNLLDWPTKIGIIIGKTDAASLSYVVEALYTQMWRKNTPDPIRGNRAQEGRGQHLVDAPVRCGLLS